MKRSQARKRQALTPAPKTKVQDRRLHDRLAMTLRTLFVRPRNDVPTTAKTGAAPRPMPVPFALPAAELETSPSDPDPILRSVLSALAPEPEEGAPEALREALVSWAEDTAEPRSAELEAVLEALDPRGAAPVSLRESLVQWACDTASPRTASLLEPEVLPAPRRGPWSTSLWQTLVIAGRRLASVFLDRLRKGSRGAR